MRARVLGASLLVVVFGCLFPVFSGAGNEQEKTDPPQERLLTDWTSLGLKVTGVKVVPKVSTPDWGGEVTTLKASKGYRMVVVTMETDVEAGTVLPIRPGEYTAIFAKQRSGETSYTVVGSSGVARNSDWSLDEEGRTTSTTYGFTKPIHLALSVAFTLPDAVTEFVLRGPGVASAEVKVPGKQIK